MPRSRIAPIVWFYGAVAISLALIGASVMNILGPPGGSLPWLLRKLNLGGENNVGAWWSGMLLAIVSLHACDGYIRCRQRAPDAAEGWALLAGVLLFLSLDEVGSIHERLGLVSHALGLGTWSLLLPLGAVLAGVALRGLVLLRRTESERSKVWPILLGFCFLASVAPQEFLEHRIEWRTEGARAARIAVEEGSELLGMLILLMVAVRNTPGLSDQGSGIGQRHAFAVLRDWRGPLVGSGLVLAPILAVATAALPDPRQGRPADWLAAAAFLAAGLVICSRLFAGAGMGWRRWSLAGLCCLSSVAAVAVSPARIVALGTAGISLRMLVLSVIACLVICACGGAVRSSPVRVAVLGVLAVAALLVTGLALVYLLSALLGIAAYGASSAVADLKTPH